MAFAPDTPPRALVRYPTRGVVRRPYKPPKAPRLGAPPPPASSGIPPTTRPPVGSTPSAPTVGAPSGAAVAGAVKQKVMTEAQWQAYHTAHGTTPTGTYDQYAAKRGVTVDPYRSLPDWARTQLGQMGVQSTQAQDQATKAAQWLASVTTPLVNARSAQDQAFAGNLNAVAGAYTAAGAPGVTPGSSASPGGMAAGGGLSHLALGAANAQAATVGPGTQALLAGQGLGARITDQIAGAARWAGQVKSTYEKQRDDYVAKIQEWKATQDSNFLTATMQATGLDTRAAAAQAGLNQRSQAQIDATNQRAAAAQAGANTRAAGVQAGASARAAAGAATKTATNTAATKAAYAKTKGTFYTDIQTKLTPRRVLKPAGQWADKGTPEYIDIPPPAGDNLKILFNQGIAKGLTPGDALRALDAGGAMLDPLTAYRWLTPHVSVARARALIKQLSGYDPGYYARTGTRNRPGTGRTNP